MKVRNVRIVFLTAGASLLRASGFLLRCPHPLRLLPELNNLLLRYLSKRIASSHKTRIMN